jgi:antitoxin component YwqK of YwqJK toxin-antitoxin module
MGSRRYLPLFFVLALLCPILLSAQDTLNRSDPQGRKTGFWRKTDNTGLKVYEGRFEAGVPAGEFRYFYPDGKVKTVSFFSDGGRRARTVSYFKNGNMMARGNYLDEKKDSTWQFFSETDGSLRSEENYLAGLKEGVSKIFLSGNVLSETFTWKGGVQEGSWTLYYSDGKFKARGAYRNGDKDGHFTFYFATGQTMITGSYLEGHQDGKWTYFSEKGEVVKWETYEKGVLLDKWPKESDQVTK